METGQPVLLDASRGRGFFASQVNSVGPKDAQRWVWLAYDQLNLAFLESLERADESLGVILIESSRKGRSKPFHQQKLAFLLSNQRHFALEVQALGIPVHFVSTDRSFGDALKGLGDFGVIESFEHAERSLRKSVETLVAEGKVILHPHPGWLTQREWFEDTLDPQVKKERLYKLNELVNQGYLEGNQRFLNEIVDVLVDGPSKNKPEILAGYTPHQKLVNFKATNEHVGKIVKVKINEVKTWYMMGELV